MALTAHESNMKAQCYNHGAPGGLLDDLEKKGCVFADLWAAFKQWEQTLGAKLWAIIDGFLNPQPLSPGSPDEPTAKAQCEAKGCPPELLVRYGALGFSFATLWALFIQYGPQLWTILQAVIAALSAKAPIPSPRP